jgi:hypothetical protein
MSKELFDAIQARVDSEIKPKITKMFDYSKTEEDKSAKYDFRDLKTDLEKVRDEFCQEYPQELVYTKLFEVTLLLSEHFLVLTRQASQGSELVSK